MTQTSLSAQSTEPVVETSFKLQTVRELERHGSFVPSLGSIISWGMKNIVISEGDLRLLLDNNNLSHVKIPNIRTRKVLNRALKEMVDDELIRLAAGNKEKTAYVLIKMSNDMELEEVSFERKHKVTYRKEAKTGEDALTFSSATAESVLRPLIEKYQISYVSGDISRFILLVTIKACGGIPLRPEGGMYFVPASKRDTVLHLRTFMDELARQQHALAYLSMFTVLDDQNAQQSMQRHAHDALKRELRDLTHMLERFTSNPDRAVRVATVSKYLEEAERISQETSLYRDLIQLEAEDIDKELNRLRQQFRALTQGEAGFGNDLPGLRSPEATMSQPQQSKFAPPSSDDTHF